MQLRCSLRIHVRYPASVQTDDSAAEGILFDLSATGCRMQSNVALTPGSYLALHFEVPETESALAVEVSIVRWHKANQFGIEFLRYAQGDRDRIADLVEGSDVPAISNHAEHEDLTLRAVAA
ncbi:MAG: PilZ domain-containing protein [Nitrospira sp.]|nr:PilZ domain-containing protein [Nitrospira sp.]